MTSISKDVSRKNTARTRAPHALQTSSEVWVTEACDLPGHNFLSFKAQDVSWVLQQETDASLQSFHIGRCRWQNCNSIRSADKYASLTTLERYDVASCGESLTVRNLSLGHSPGVFTPLLFNCKPEFLINNSACLGSASISIRSGAFPNGGTIHRSTRFRNVHMSQGVVVWVPMLQDAARANVCSSLP